MTGVDSLEIVVPSPSSAEVGEEERERVMSCTLAMLSAEPPALPALPLLLLLELRLVLLGLLLRLLDGETFLFLFPMTPLADDSSMRRRPFLTFSIRGFKSFVQPAIKGFSRSRVKARHEDRLSCVVASSIARQIRRNALRPSFSSVDDNAVLDRRTYEQTVEIEGRGGDYYLIEPTQP